MSSRPSRRGSKTAEQLIDSIQQQLDELRQVLNEQKQPPPQSTYWRPRPQMYDMPPQAESSYPLSTESAEYGRNEPGTYVDPSGIGGVNVSATGSKTQMRC